MTAKGILTVGKPCKKCGSTARRASGRCDPCATSFDKKYYQENAEKLKAYQAALYLENPEKKKAHSIAYYAANIDVIKPKRIEYAKSKAAHINAKSREWAKNNPEKAKQRLIKWRRENPEAHKIIYHNRRERKKTGTLSKNIVEKLLASQNRKCPCCGLPLGNSYHLDHIMPLALGGTNTDNNVQLLRAKCNLQKNKKHPVDFMRERGFLI